MLIFNISDSGSCLTQLVRMLKNDDCLLSEHSTVSPIGSFTNMTTN